MYNSCGDMHDPMHIIVVVVYYCYVLLLTYHNLLYQFLVTLKDNYAENACKNGKVLDCY